MQKKFCDVLAKMQTLPNTDARSQSDRFNYRIYSDSTTTADDVAETREASDEIQKATSAFSNVISTCCNGAGSEGLNSLIDQCKKNVKKSYDTEENALRLKLLMPYSEMKLKLFNAVLIAVKNLIVKEKKLINGR